MAWIGVGIALVAALAIAACTAAILRRLPMPVDEPDARPYAELISPRLFVTMLVSSFAALLLSLLLSDPTRWPVWVVMGTLGVLLAVVDAHTGFLPRLLTWWFGGLVLAATIAVAVLAGNPLVVLIAVLCGAGSGLLFRLLWQIGGGLGFGDVRLVTVLGTAAGATSVELAVWSLLLGGVAGVVWGVAARLRRGSDGPFPYGPSLVLGPYLALLVGLGLTLAGLD
ncbi:MAG: hypothetical protein KIT69_08175 [Propionibacteriaceae bacterium]|nr:hypothetical protein [Propionibacteriaceae bacterium]